MPLTPPTPPILGFAAALLALVILVPARPWADEQSDCIARETAKGHDQAASKTICTLRKHFQNRIRYKPDTEPVEMTVGSPPMISDDTDTPGPGNWELNAVFHGERASSERSFEAPLLDVNFGVGERLQLKYEVAYVSERSTGNGAAGQRETVTERAVGDSVAGIKYRFYDDGETGASLALYPQIRFHTPGAGRAVAEEGTSFILPLLLTSEFESVSLTANLGVEHFRADERNDYFASIGVGTRLSDHVALMAEIAGQDLRESSARRYIVNLGLRRKFNDKHALLASIGRDLHAPDGGARSSYVSISYQRLFGK